MDKKNNYLSNVATIYLATTVFLVVLSLYVFIQVKNLIDTSNWVNHTNQVTLSLQRISSAIIEAETNQRGYLLTGNSLLLMKRDLAFDNLSRELRLVDSLTKDNPEQIQHLKTLHVALDEKLKSMQKVLNDYIPLQMTTAFKDNVVEGVYKMEEVKRRLHIMAQTENNLLHQRIQKYSRLSFLTPLFIIVLFLLALLILLLSYFRISNALYLTRQLQSTVMERTDQLKISNHLLEYKNVELEKINKELQSFVYISSHDLQEPLRKIQTFATRLLEKEYSNLSDNGQQHFSRMQEAARRMQLLIDDLIHYSRVTTKERKFEKTNLTTLVKAVEEDLSEDLKEKQATLDIAELGEANIIPFQFRQLLHNLISNALKFSHPSNPPCIKINSEIAEGHQLNNEKLSPQKRYYHLSVADNGIGFEPQYAEKIFEVFQRLHGKTEYQGTGIGLSIVKKIVENHDGFITASSELNQGATFDIYISAS